MKLLQQPVKEKLLFLKGFSKNNINSQPISFKYNFRHLKCFLKLAAKVAVNVLFQIRFLKINFGHMTDIPTAAFYNKFLLAARTASS